VAKKATELVQFKLRIREGLRRQIEREANKNGRSVNAEAVERLERSFEQQQTAEVIKDTARTAAFDAVQLVLERWKIDPEAFAADWAVEREGQKEQQEEK
jgi:hypothetical protein